MGREKRKAVENSPEGPKKARKFEDRTRYKDSTQEIKYGIVLPKYYPHEMSNERARKYISGEIERPIETLKHAMEETIQDRENMSARNSVIHWFKSDLRMTDNRALHLASEKAKSAGVPLLCVFLISPQDWEAHLTAPVRVDFILRTLEVLKKDLAALDIPLYIEVVEKRRNIPSTLIKLCERWGTSHIFCNEEYEVDELRREASLVGDCLRGNISFNVISDTCVVKPGTLTTEKGGQISIYSPWHRKWVAYLNQHMEELQELPKPQKNPSNTRDNYASLFDCKIPDSPDSKRLSDDEKKRFGNMWPAGEEEALSRLNKFVSQRIRKYSEARNLPGSNGTSVLSPHLAAGTIAARTCVRVAMEASPNKKLIDDRRQGHSMWYGEVAWRDFYKHVLAHWPFVCMNKPFKIEYTNIEWEYNLDEFKAWTEGKTGFPIVDAAMRQLLHTGWMHNRCRMIVASFLTKDLMIDWRMGEKWFMEHLVDGDFASNNGGWGWSASSGVDPQPYFRIFNPLLQSEKFDPDGSYIRKWVPELKDVKSSKDIHDPYGRGAETIAKKNGYPKPIVDHKVSRERALSRYKAGLGRGVA